MLVYNLFQGCTASALVYPAREDRRGIAGNYQSEHGTECSLQFVPLIKPGEVIEPKPEAIVKLIIDITPSL